MICLAYLRLRLCRVILRLPSKVEASRAEARKHCLAQQAQLTVCTQRYAQAVGQIPKPSAGGESPQGASRGAERSPLRQDALRSLLDTLRSAGHGIHGMLADLLLIRSRRQEAAVVAVVGPLLHNTVVVQTRQDGARVLACARSAGIRGIVRCDVVNELTGRTGT